MIDNRIAFVLAHTQQGTLIVNRLDIRPTNDNMAIGVGFTTLQQGAYEPTESRETLELLSACRACNGDGVIAVDCGANIGCFTVPWAMHMTGWGHVLAIEPQEWLYYALAGNLALNNCFNARAILAAVGETDRAIEIPKPDYQTEASFGSLELRHKTDEGIGQEVTETMMVPMITLDSLFLDRLDFLKIDVEGMEMSVMTGARAAISKYRPVMLIEYAKVGLETLTTELRALDYHWHRCGINLVAVHNKSKIQNLIQTETSS